MDSGKFWYKSSYSVSEAIDFIRTKVCLYYFISPTVTIGDNTSTGDSTSNNSYAELTSTLDDLRLACNQQDLKVSSKKNNLVSLMTNLLEDISIYIRSLAENSSLQQF